MLLIEFLLPDPPTKFAKMVMSHGVELHNNGDPYQIKMSRHGRQKGKMIPSKSYTLGAYPRNVIGEKDYD